MSNPSKSKGTRFETEVVTYLRAHGFPHAERRALSGNQDRGDILFTPGLIGECKAVAVYSQADVEDWQQQTWREMQHSNAALGVLIIKAPRRSIDLARFMFRGEWSYWYEQTLTNGVERLRVLGWGEPLA